MAGLVPAIHVFHFSRQSKQDVDGRHEAGHDRSHGTVTGPEVTTRSFQSAVGPDTSSLPAT
jgi:hypothetical protein